MAATPTPKYQTGFTLVEIIIFFALISIVFLIIFFALPGAQREQRNTKRKADLAALAENLDKEKEATVLDHHFPSGSTLCGAPDFNCLFDPRQGAGAIYAIPNDIDPLSHTEYTYMTSGTPPTPTTTTAAGILYQFNVLCNHSTYSGDQTELYSLTIVLEGGATYCIDDH